jgi:hypothetical protein
VSEAIDRSTARLTGTGTALFCYSRHGIQVAGENFLVLVDLDAKDEADGNTKVTPCPRTSRARGRNGANISASRWPPDETTRARASQGVSAAASSHRRGEPTTGATRSSRSVRIASAETKRWRLG